MDPLEFWNLSPIRTPRSRLVADDTYFVHIACPYSSITCMQKPTFISKLWQMPHSISDMSRLGFYNWRAKLLQQQYEEPQRWVFVNPRTHKPFRCIFHRWNKIRTELGIGDVRIHDLRHSYASTLVNNGATLYEVQKLLGHSKSQTTERYAHLANHTLIQAASLIDKAFSR